MQPARDTGNVRQPLVALDKDLGIATTALMSYIRLKLCKANNWLVPNQNKNPESGRFTLAHGEVPYSTEKAKSAL